MPLTAICINKKFSDTKDSYQDHR